MDEPGNDASDRVSISDDGSRIAVTTNATNLAPTTGLSNVMVFENPLFGK